MFQLKPYNTLLQNGRKRKLDKSGVFWVFLTVDSEGFFGFLFVELKVKSSYANY